MSSELQLDVRHLNRWRRHLVNAYEVRQAWCLLQVKLCDPCLSALKWSLPCKALYKCSALPLPLPSDQKELVGLCSKDIQSIGLSELDAQILNKSGTKITQEKVADTSLPQLLKTHLFG